MLSNYYIYNKLVEEHRHDLSQEAQRERLLRMLRHHPNSAEGHLDAKQHSRPSMSGSHDGEQA